MQSSKVSQLAPQVNVQDLQAKILKSRQLNTKLKSLLSCIQSNSHAKNLELSSMSGSNKLKQAHQKMAKLQHEIQKMKHLQNLLLNQNKQLKEVVNNKRKERVIYSSVFKKYEKNIILWEGKFKNEIIDQLVMDECIKDVKEKVNREKRLLEKEINRLNKLKREKELQSEMKAMQLEQGKKNQSSNFNKQSSLHNYNSSSLSCSSQKSYNKTQSQQRLASQKRLQIKSKQLQIEYQEEMRKLFIQKVTKQLKDITGQSDMSRVIQIWNSIDQMIQSKYQQYQTKQKLKKQLQDQTCLLQKQLSLKNGKRLPEKQPLSDNQVKTQSAETIQSLLQRQQKVTLHLQNLVQSSLKINLHSVPTDQIKSFVKSYLQSISCQPQTQEDYENDCFEEENRNIKQLQKRLESVQKQKQVKDYVMSYDQIKQQLITKSLSPS